MPAMPALIAYAETIRPNWPGVTPNTRMYCGPSGMMMRKSTMVVNWMAARTNSSNRSLMGLACSPEVGTSLVISIVFTESSARRRLPHATPRHWSRKRGGWPRNTTSAATSSVVAKRCNSELGRTVRKTSCSIFAGVVFLDFAISAMNFSMPSERVGPASTELTVRPVPAVDSASPRASATCIVLVTP